MTDELKLRMTEIARKWMRPDSEAAPEFHWGDFYDCVFEIMHGAGERMTEREKFEAWAKQQQPGTLDLTPFDDTYDSDFTSRAWDAWQARAALESRVLAERKQEPVAQIIRRKTYSGLDVWDIKIFDKDMQHGTKLFTHPTPDDAKTREAFERALKQTYEMVDPLNPPVPGSYARGEHNGIIAALKTVRANFDAAIDRARQSGEEGK